MITVDVRADFGNVLKALDLVNKDLNKSIVMAINKVAASARTEAARNVSKSSNIKVNEVRRKIPLIRANRTSLTAVVKAEPWSPNLIRYQARQTKKGVSAKAWGSRKVYKGSFIGNQGRTVFTRAGEYTSRKPRTLGKHQRKGFTRQTKSGAVSVSATTVGSGPKQRRQALKALHGPSVPKEFMRDANISALLKMINKQLPTELTRSAAEIIRRRGLAR